MHLIALLVALIMPGSPHFERGKQPLPYQARWGTYRIVVEKYGRQDQEAQQRVRILDAKGRTLREVRGHWITRVDTVELTGRAPDELHIQESSRHMYCCTTDVYFTCEGGLHNLLIFRGQDLGIQAIKDLNGDGRPEIIAQNPALMDFSGWTFARSTILITVLGWNGRRYTDATRTYPQRSLDTARMYQKEITGCLSERDSEGESHRDWRVEGRVTGYYANMIAIGRGREARAWIIRHVPRFIRGWLNEHEQELRQIIATALPRRSRVSQSKILFLRSDTG